MRAIDERSNNAFYLATKHETYEGLSNFGETSYTIIFLADGFSPTRPRTCRIAVW